MIKQLLKFKYLIISFIILEIIVAFTISLSKSHEIETILENKTEIAQIEYDTIYSKIKSQSLMIFQESINKPSVIELFKNAYTADEETKKTIRENLHSHLYTSYMRMRILLHIRQLHFHLPNNHSFLRMHRPAKFGDDLTGIRQTVEYVNKNHKMIHGFEEGRVYNGFRFVYPLFDQKKYIGSVEVSFDVSSFKDALNNNLHNAQFIISKNVIEKKVWKDEDNSNYSSTKISSKFLIEKNKTGNLSDPFSDSFKASITTRISEAFHVNISSGISYSIPLKIEGKTNILSFLPIKNPITNHTVAYMIIVSKSKHLDEKDLKYYIMQTIAFAFILSIFTIIYRNTLQQNRLITNRIKLLEQQKLLEEQSKMAQMGSMLSNIAHQWKQPLAQINSKLIEMPLSLKLTSTDKESLDNSIESIEELTSYMATTLEDFITYFHPNKKKTNFTIKQTIDKAILLSNLKSSTEGIHIVVECSSDTKLLSYENELMQVLITLLINAEEAFDNKDIKNPTIKAISTVDKNIVKITIIDNAGGIEDNLVGKIFNPYFSTKNRNENSGIGLYMAKMIIEGSMQGKLEYEKVNDESNFKITIENAKDE